MKTAGPCGLTVAWDRSIHESLVRAIAHQQLHGKAAANILARLIAAFPKTPFPTPRQLIRAPVDKLRTAGFSLSKVAAIQAVSKGVENGQIPERGEAEALTNAELIERITFVRGVGKWTVEMLLIFTLGRMDVMPVDDFGVQYGLQNLLMLNSLPKKREVDALTQDWSPYRSVAAWYLWRKAEASRMKSAVK